VPNEHDNTRFPAGWRAAFVFQALIIVVIVVLARGVIDPVPPDPGRVRVSRRWVPR
jgi:hypothetical protein